MSSISAVPEASSVEEMARPAAVDWFDSGDLDAMWRLNRSWLLVKQEKRPKLQIAKFIGAHDPVLRPFLRTFFDSLDCRMISFHAFYEHFALSANAVLDYLEANLPVGAPVYLWGGETFGKSNTWTNMLFWDIYRARYNCANVFDFRLVGLKSILNLKIHLLLIDDCMYSGEQML
jgi:hypothetical protein